MSQRQEESDAVAAEIMNRSVCSFCAGTGWMLLLDGPDEGDLHEEPCDYCDAYKRLPKAAVGYTDVF